MGENFLSQFPEIPYLERNRVQQDLQIICGATISSRGVAEGYRRPMDALAYQLGWGEKHEVTPAELPLGIYQGRGFGLYNELGVLYHLAALSSAEYAFHTLKEEVLEKQNLQIHTITGATYSSTSL